MIVMVILTVHDYEPCYRVVDTSLMDKNNPVDAGILESINQNIPNGSYWPDGDIDFHDVSSSCLLDLPQTIERVIFFHVRYE